MALRPEEEFDREVMRGMARHLWVHAYMLWATQVEPPPQPGQSWEEMAPDNASTRAASRQAAQELREMIESSNHLSGQHILGRLFISAVDQRRGRPPGRPSDAQPGKRKGATEADLAFAFGEDLAGICMGTLEPEDSVLPLPARFVLPTFSVQLDDDGHQISWDGGFSYAGDEVEEAVSPKENCGCHPNPGGSLEILVIEDEDIVQKMYPRLLRKLYKGAEVFVVDNYDAAIGYLKTHDIKLVISDVDILGDKSGIDVFEWVKAHQPYLVDRYVFVTGGNPHVADLHYRYLEKPFMPEELWETIRRKAPEPGASARAPARPTTTPPPRTAAAPARARTTTAKPKAAAAAKRTHAELVAYADHIHELAAHRGTRFGDRKVFLGSIPGFDLHDPALLADLDLLRRSRLVELARADLVSAMDPALVRASEWKMDGATYHFLVLPEKYRKAAPTQPPRAAPSTMDLATFARIVRETGAAVPRDARDGRAYGRLGDKVFISAIWRVLSQDPRFRGMDLATFKRRLVEANRDTLLDLRRLDLSGAADLGEQAESRIEDHGSEFHTVYIEDAPRRNPAGRRQEAERLRRRP